MQRRSLEIYDEVAEWGAKAFAAFDERFELHWSVWARLGVGWSAA